MRMGRRNARGGGRAVGLAAVVAAGALSACGGGSGGGPHASAVTSASVPASASARASTPPAAAGDTVIRAANAKTARAGSARIHLVEHLSPAGGASPIAVTLDAVSATAQPRLRGTETLPGATVEVIQLGTVEYLRPTDGGNLPAGKTWGKIDFGDSFNVGTPGGGDLGSLTQMLGSLNQATSSVDRVGTDTVGGAPATHYKVTYHARSGATPATAPTVNLPADLWIGPDGRVAKVHQVITLTARAEAGQGPATADVTVTYSDYGTPLPDLSPPPAGQVADLTSQVAGTVQHA
jgi:hypothetical protein